MRALLLVLLVGCSSPSGGDDDVAAADAAPAGADASAELYIPAGYTLTPFLSDDAQHTFAAAGQVVEAGKDYLAVIDTDQGRIVMDLLETDTPITVNSFVWLALHHFYDGIAFHRVIDSFMAQTGDPNTLSADTSQWGNGGPGYMFGLEIVPTLNYDAAGVVGMARTNDPNTNGSQFFITFNATPSLNGQYTIFAKLTEGFNVLQLIVRGEPPTTPFVTPPTRMQRVYIVEKAI